MNYKTIISQAKSQSTQVLIKGMPGAALSELIDEGLYTLMSAKYPNSKTYTGIYKYKADTKCSVIEISGGPNKGQLVIIPSTQLSKV